MKTSKTIWAPVVFAVISVLALLPAHKVFALVQGQITGGGINLAFKDRTTISGTVNGAAVTYVDNNPWDTTYNYVIQQSGVFCNPGTPSNITILNNDIATSTGGSSTVHARLDARTSTDGTQNGCTINNSVPFNVNNPSAAMTLFEWQTSGQLQVIGGASLTEVGSSDIYESDPNATCGGGTVAVVKGSGATLYNLTSSARASIRSRWPVANMFFAAGGPTFVQSWPPTSAFSDFNSSSLASGCYVNGVNGDTKSSDTGNFQNLSKLTYSIAGTRPTLGTGGVGSGTGGSTACDPTLESDCVNCTYNAQLSRLQCTQPTGTTSANGDTCELKSNGLSLAWLFCPVLEASDVLATNLMQTFEDQLPFCVEHSGITCSVTANKGQSLGSGQDEVKTAWTVIKDLASALIVVVMLIMVFSQAIGSGPFDAYTVRKMLPRLAAAVILIQISWELAAFVIDIFNDIGNGVGKLLYAPFGGASQLDFGSLLANAHVGTGSGIFIGWLGAFLGVAIGVAFLPTVLFAALVAVLTLLVGLAVLVFRKILIILLIMLSPLAIVFWILPGQGLQKYWKLWQDNFIKVLMMFPLIVSIIAAGRIFAFVVGATKNGTFLNFWFVVAGYFLPLFILPRAYRWGGGIMTAAGNQLNSLQRSVQGAAKQPLKQFGFDIYQGKRADQYDPTQGRLSIGRKKFLGKYGKAIMPDFKGRAFRRIQSGNFLPTNRSRNLTLKKGEEWSSTRTTEALAYEQKFSRIHQERGVTKQEAARWNKSANAFAKKRGYTGPALDIFKEREKGVGAGKWAAMALFWDAYAKGDAPLQKAVADHLIKSKSGLEFRNPNFVAPYFDESTGKLEAVPFFGHPLTVDRAFKEPDLYSILGSLGGDLPPHNTPYGGNGGLLATGYQKVYKRGIHWVQDSAGRVTENRDYNPDIASTFGITVGQTQDKPWIMSNDLEPRTATNPSGHYNPEAWAAHYAQASYDDAVNNIAMGGSMGGAFMNMLIHGSHSGFAPGEGANAMPIRQAAWAVVEATRTQQGRDKLSTIYTDPSTREIAENMFRAAGVTKFKDTFGVEHDFSIQNLWAANTSGEERMKRGEKPLLPGRLESLGTSGPGGSFVSIYNVPPPPPPPPGTPPAPTPAPTPPPSPAPAAPAAPLPPPSPTPAPSPSTSTAGSTQPVTAAAGTTAAGATETTEATGAPGSIAFGQLVNAIEANTSSNESLRRALREGQGRVETHQVPTEGGVLYVQQPSFRPGDTVRPVPGSDIPIVIPPGTRSLEDRPAGGDRPSEPPAG